ncbi:DUF6020 family protein [Nocardioides jishulii]|uniref:Glycosyltransferase RgtA/B/C/D-like domain-containing protein n=1 Tax=Nocardioides jishulii TaxID=2575440 RepID=A0A4U2YSP2_9ACTN|nr:DUF6020 family protein [Nocardioides jishulii]QCX26390.1 hypothetical protein FCL41_01650 [Nocardioides jishulii]TKI63805.1 hypothetical protein FC770_01055 [Nocardioides jishulii]
MPPGLTKFCAAVAGWVAVVVVATATAIGFIARFLAPDDAPYFLLTAVVADRPVASLLVWALCLAAYAVLFRWTCRWLDRWRHGVTSRPAQGVWTRRLERAVTWVFARWWHGAVAVAVLWSPWILLSWPGQPNPDFARMIGEFLLERSDFTDGVIAPYEAYPTSHYLLPDSERIWSNHHNFYLMLYYGAVTKASIVLFDSAMPGIFLLSTLSLIFTLVAFGRAFSILGRLVTSWKVRALALAVVAGSPLIAVWSMSHTKNHLFAAAFVWWLALVAQYVHSPKPVGRRWYVETTVISLAVAVSVLFGWILLVVQALVMLGVRRGRFAPLAVMAVPALLVHGTVSAAVAFGVLIPGDPIETKGVQLQQLALILREHPDALSTEDREALSRIFDLEAMAAAYDPDISDPVKSTGPYAKKTESFRYQTVQPEDWDDFTGIWLRAGAEHPDTFVDALVAKSYRYLDPFDQGTHWYPPWKGDYERVVGDHSIAPVPVNDAARPALREWAGGCYSAELCRPLLSHSVRTVAVVLLCAAAIVVRRRFAWLWAMPFALQVGIVAMSPLAAGGRYALGFTYGLAVVVLLMAMDDRQPEQTPAEVPASG